MLEQKYIDIRGRHVRWDALISALDSSRFEIGRLKADKEFSLYCRRIDAVQTAIDHYANDDATEMEGFIEERLEYCQMPIPKTKTYPDAIFSMYEDLERLTSAPLDKFVLDKAVKATERIEERDKEKQEKIKAWKEGIAALGVPGCLSDDSKENIVYLTTFLSSISSTSFVLRGFNLDGVRYSEKDCIVLMIDLLLEKISGDDVSLGVLKRLVESGAVSESDISDLLKESGDNRDYEWYTEDMIGCDLADKTKIPAGDIAKIAWEKLVKASGAKSE